MVPGSSAIVCFLDESETDANTEQAVVGGITLRRGDLPEFDERWTAMLTKHGLTNCLHMIDLGLKGPYPSLIGDACAAMLTEAVTIINDCRIITLVAPLDNRKHETFVSAEIRNYNFSVYFLAFLMAVTINHANAEHCGYQGNVDFILDAGNKFATHIEAANGPIHKEAGFEGFQIGDIEFGTDSSILALQAADVIAWSARRRNAKKPFGHPHHTPLPTLFAGAFIDPILPDAALTQMAQAFADKLIPTGRAARV